MLLLLLLLVLLALYEVAVLIKRRGYMNTQERSGLFCACECKGKCECKDKCE
jgi:hypothetical protein